MTSASPAWMIAACLLLVPLLPAAEPVPPFRWAGQELPQPALRGVDALAVINASRVAIGLDTSALLVAELDRASNGEYRRLLATWQAGKTAARPPWEQRKRMFDMRDAGAAAAREAIGERKLGEAATFTISSSDDPAYAGGKAAAAARLMIIGLDGGENEGLLPVRYGIWSYLDLPTPMQPGKSYEIRLGGPFAGRSAGLTWNLDTCVSRAIKIDQVGYALGSTAPFAYLGWWIPGLGAVDFGELPAWEAVDAASGAVVAQGAARLRDAASRFLPTKDAPDQDKRPHITGEKVYEIDLSGIRAPGSYYLRVAGVGRSWPFRVAADVYGEAFYIAMRGLYHQRGSFALEQPWTAWTRPRLHTQPVFESQLPPYGVGALGQPRGFERFDVVGGSLDRTRSTADVVGGWYDAADWDRGFAHYTVSFDLCWLYDQRPAAFTDRQLNIPESGNGIPDLLDEAEFGLRVWLRSQTAAGAVAGWVEARTHPSGTDERYPYAYSLRTRWSTLGFAAAASWLARQLQPFDAKLSATYLAAARKAFTWGIDPANSLGEVQIQARKRRGDGDPYTIAWNEREEQWRPYELLARQHLFLATGEEAYLSGLAELAAKAPVPYAHPWSNKDHSVRFSELLAVGSAPPGIPAERLAQLRTSIPAELAQRFATQILAPADALAGLCDTMPYRMTWPKQQDYWMGWGASSLHNHNRALLSAASLRPADAYRTAIQANAAYMFGANPLGLSWTTGIGVVYPVVLQHESSEIDGIRDPVPGLSVYGVDGGTHGDLRRQAWSMKQGSGTVDFCNPGVVPTFRRWSAHPHTNAGQCEFTIHETMAATILSTAMLMPDGWQPPAALLTRGPRPEAHCFGYWYLP